VSEKLPRNFPNIPDRYKRQMKDVEFIGLLLLFLEQGEKSYSQLQLDHEFLERDDQWADKIDITSKFVRVIEEIAALIHEFGAEIVRSRLRNQADFYSLFGAFSELLDTGCLPSPDISWRRLLEFLSRVGDQESWPEHARAGTYFQAARSASNDPGPRRVRIDILKDVLVGRN
jgi:hypothetical protein